MPPDKWEIDRNKKIKFLLDAQGIPQYAFEPDSPLVYRYDESQQCWNAYRLLDGFLASALFGNAMNQKAQGVILTELPDCTKRTFSTKGKLGRFLSPVENKLTKESPHALYTSPDHKMLALYDSELKTAYLASVGEAPLKQLEKKANITLSWL